MFTSVKLNCLAGVTVVDVVNGQRTTGFPANGLRSLVWNFGLGSRQMRIVDVIPIDDVISAFRIRFRSIDNTRCHAEVPVRRSELFPAERTCNHRIDFFL